MSHLLKIWRPVRNSQQSLVPSCHWLLTPVRQSDRRQETGDVNIYIFLSLADSVTRSCACLRQTEAALALAHPRPLPQPSPVAPPAPLKTTHLQQSS